MSPEVKQTQQPVEQQPVEQQRKPKADGLLPVLLELAGSFGGYYLLRALGVDVFWSLTVPAILVLAIAAVVTIRRGRVDLIGLLVLLEIVLTISISLVTQNARVAASREPLYILVGGLFCLFTLFYRTPFSHVSSSSIATFGDPKRERAFRLAWQEVPRYRMWQRLLTAVFGLIMVVSAIIRLGILYSSPDSQVAHAVNVSNVISLVMIGALVGVSGILIQPPRKIIENLVEHM